MATNFQIDKQLEAGPVLRVMNDPKGFWLLEFLIKDVVQGSAFAVSQSEAFDFQQNLFGVYQASLSAISHNIVDAKNGITRPLASGVTLEIQNDPKLVGFWTMRFLLSSDQSLIGAPIAITKLEAFTIAQDLPKIFSLTLSK